MAAVQETIEQVRKIDVDQYKYGFETKIETVKAPKGLNEDIVRFISEKKGEPAWMLEWRLESFRRWLGMIEPKGERQISQDRLQRTLLLRRSEIDRGTEVSGGCRPGIARHV